MHKQLDIVSHSTVINTEDSPKTTYHKPVLTILGEAAKLTKGTENGENVDCAMPGHSVDPCS